MTKCQIQAEKAERRAKGLKEIRLLEAKGYRVTALNPPYQFRIEDSVIVYPTSRRFHSVKHKTRGTYNNLEARLINLSVHKSNKFDLIYYLSTLLFG